MDATYDTPMKMQIRLSPAITENRGLKHEKTWKVTDLVSKPFKPEPQAPPTPLVKSVKGEETAVPDTELEYKVTDYNINVSKANKDRIQWKVKVGKEESVLQPEKGETIKLKIKQEWAGKEILVMPYLKTPTERVSVKTNIKSNRCKCSGNHDLNILGILSIPSYTGELKSPFKIIFYTPSKDDPLFIISSKTIRRWIKDAAIYHEIPQEILAVIVQQENAPSASEWKKLLQFGERTITTIAAHLDANLWDLVPDKLADSSSGIMNMRRLTLKDTIQYTKQTYGRELMPKDVANRIGYIYDTNVDVGIQGGDWRADLYYGAAHIRQLIDRILGVCAKGDISIAQVEQVFKSYNGSGTMADKYGKDAVNLLNGAAEGTKILYFYEK